MKKTKLLCLLLLGFSQTTFSQSPDPVHDSTLTQFTLGIRGIWSTGNTHMLSIQPNTSLLVRNNSFLLALTARYDYIKIQKINTSNDFWSNVTFQLYQKNKWYPFFTINGGTAKSFAIKHFVIAGGGIGRNIFYKSQNYFMQLHLYGAYHTAFFVDNPTIESFVIGGLLKSKLSLNKEVNIQWDLASYHSTEQESYWGMRNFLILTFKIIKQLNVNINHQLFYNHEQLRGIEKLNTTLLFGLNYRIEK